MTTLLDRLREATEGSGELGFVGTSEEFALLVEAKRRIEELENIVARQRDMLDSIASQAGFLTGEAYTWMAVVDRLREQKTQ